MVKKAAELAEKHGWFLARQFENEANPAYHRNTTGPEILQDFVGKRLDYFVTGWGTGGTLTGAGEMIRLARPEVQIIATEPAGAALLAGKPWQPHKIQGWTPDFVPTVLKKEVAHKIVAGARTPRRSRPRARWRRRKAFSAASPRAARSRRRSRSRRGRARLGDPRDAARTPASAISRRCSSRASPRARIRNPKRAAEPHPPPATAAAPWTRASTPRCPIRFPCGAAARCTAAASPTRPGGR